MAVGSARSSRCCAALGLTALGLQACGAPATPTAPAPKPAPALVPEAPPAPRRGTEPPAQNNAAATSPEVSVPEPSPACPNDMMHVRHDFCPDMVRECAKSEYDRPNRITICHEFEEKPGTCRAERRALDYCIDRFEYPNEKGGHPPVMVDFHDAERACLARSKRLCLESEWITACEGPEETPFPYGYRRSSEKCNIDNRWIEPSLAKIYSKRGEIREAELARLDQSVPSGAREGCVSGFEVHDLTGNFDEWVRLDEPMPKARSKYAGLKGGAWGHVRNACRPVTTSHAPEFSYYFVSFRCCKDSER